MGRLTVKGPFGAERTLEVPSPGLDLRTFTRRVEAGELTVVKGKAPEMEEDAPLDLVPDTTIVPDPSASETAGRFDPSEHSVADVNAHLDGADDAERQRVLATERDGKARRGVVEGPHGDAS